MAIVMQVIEKNGRIIHLTQERWTHIRNDHPAIQNMEIIRRALESPTAMRPSDRDENVTWYFRHDKHRKQYLKVSVKYLNGTGFIITAHFTSKIA